MKSNIINYPIGVIQTVVNDIKRENRKKAIVQGTGMNIDQLLSKSINSSNETISSQYEKLNTLPENKR